MQKEYDKLIQELDKVLSTVREFWMNAKTDSEKEKWRLRLDQSLDERLRLMGCRDTAKKVFSKQA